MSATVLILRPQPDADRTAARALALGLNAVAAPLFAVRPLAWAPPEAAAFDAVMLTSANAARHGGPGLTAYLDLPCYAVGEATADAGRAAGFRDLHSGSEDGRALLNMMAADGIGTALHLCGRDRLDLRHPGVAISAIPVYAAEAMDRLPAAAEAALDEGALALLHSPRGAASFGALVGARRERIDVAAISAAAAAAAGEGWRSLAVAARPSDQALLELAAKLCQTAPQ